MPVTYKEKPKYDITEPGLTEQQKEFRVKSFLRYRLSKNWIMQDFMKGVTYSAADLSGYPKANHDHILKSGIALANVLEAIEEQFGRCTITYGYKTPEQADYIQKGRDSDPHCWDKGTRFKGQIFARMDVMIYSVEDGEFTKEQVASWLIKNTMVDLIMTWEKSNVFCITIAPMARRVYKEWKIKGGSVTLIGEDYWQNVYGTASDWLKPMGRPSVSGGHMNWFNKNFKARGY